MLKIIKGNEIIISLRLQTQWDWTLIHISVGAAASREAGEVMGRRRRATRLEDLMNVAAKHWCRPSADAGRRGAHWAATCFSCRVYAPICSSSISGTAQTPASSRGQRGERGQMVERRFSRAALTPSTAVRYLEHISILCRCCCCCLCRLYLAFHSLIPASPLPPTPISPLSSSPSKASSDSRQNSLKWNCCRL